jgi:membrane-associated protease RseP (regulator of RpoE activity)
MTNIPPPPKPLPPPKARHRLDIEPADGPALDLTRGQSFARLGMLAAAIVALGVFYNWWAVAFIVGLLICIFLHEVGHYVAAKRAGMKVTQFFMFFGPRIWSFKKGETEYGIRAIPAGAFVKVPGMHNLDTEVDPAEEQRTYRAAPFHSRLAMASAGSLMHFAIALLCLFFAFAAFGRVKVKDSWKVAYGPGTASVPGHVPAVGSSAAAADLREGDRIVSIDNQTFPTFETAAAYWRAHTGETLSFVIDRNGERLVKPITINDSTDPCRPGGKLGVGAEFDSSVRRDAPHVAVGQSFVQFGAIAKDSVLGLGKIFSVSGLKKYGKALTTQCSTNERFVSPIGFAQIGSQVAKSGWGNSLLFFAAVNIFIGMFNWVPLLPFDGGHMAIACYEKIRGRKNKSYRADITRLLPLSYAVFIIMAFMTLGNTYLDLVRGVGS